MATISIGATSIHYLAEGEGDWLVLLHEIGGTLHSWDAVALALARSFTVLRHDQRGAGKSGRISGDFSIEMQIDDLTALLDRLDAPQPCHIAGVAIGAALAVRFAVRFPHRVASLVLACPAPGVGAARAQYLAQRAALVEREGMAATVDNSLANSYPPEVRRDSAAFEAYRIRFLANDPVSYAAISRAFIDFDVTPELRKVACPTLVVAGTHDQLRPPEFVRGVAAAIPGADYRDIDSGHVMPVQEPAAMVEAMQAFYARIGAGKYAAAKSP
jgi:3-oxoadipate enol-lactonase